MSKKLTVKREKKLKLLEILEVNLLFGIVSTSEFKVRFGF